ncbi:methionine adenosyltransferase domain-containing protein [Candidatus Uhrbacteria bacterium]|nr:methionine adenosyltransferase domain-containing protein [Candidatus Uhrbacteria bacterium]
MLKTVESVTAGQPDKVCDQIADGIVDEYLRRDPKARLDLHVLGSHGMLMVGGEVQSEADFDVGALAKKIYQEIGYPDDMEVFANIAPSSEEMRQVKTGVMDTVVINGYATQETRERLPKAVVYAHTLARRLDDLRKTDPAFSWMKPDGKVQVAMQGDRVHTVTLLCGHHVSIGEREVRSALLERIVIPLVGEEGVQIYINPIGLFTVCGFRADSGASGRKVTVDTYGGLIPHGDKSLGGKDPLRAERSGAYGARAAACFLVGEGLATAALVNLVYTMGRAEPIHVHAVGMGEKSRGSKMDLTALIKTQFDFRPEAIVERFQLCQPIYQRTATYGAFGRAGLPWEPES